MMRTKPHFASAVVTATISPLVHSFLFFERLSFLNNLDGKRVDWLLHMFVLYNNSCHIKQSYTKTVDMTDNAKKLGANIKRIRALQGMSQGDLCRALALDRAYISNVENGKKNPTLSTITNIAKALNVSADELLK